MPGFVGALHDFHDPDFAQGWADRFVPTAPRLRLFDLILDRIAALDRAAPHVVELGTGPGYMARHILDRHDALSYEAVDFSPAFFAIARKTLGAAAGRVTFARADLLDQSWPRALSRRPDAIVSTWALHDLGSQQAVAEVYARCHDILPPDGVLLNGDFIKPEGTDFDFEPGRFGIARHLQMLTRAGFGKPACIAHLEPNTDNPTPAQNYACLVAHR